MSKRAYLILAALCLVFAIAGCQASAPKTRKTLGEWSRGLQLGATAIKQPVSMDSAGGAAQLLWVGADAKALHYVRLSLSGQIETDTDIGVNGSHPSLPQIHISPDGSSRILWTDNPRIPRALFITRVSPDAQAGEIRRLSTEGMRVSEYAVAHNADDTLDVFWATEVPTEGGIYHLRLSAQDQVLTPNHQIIANGSKPTLQQARDGSIHLIWVEGQSMQENNVYYSVFRPDSGDLTARTRVGFYRTGTGLVSNPPVLGIDGTTAYVLWSLEARGGGQAGEAQTWLISFPVGRPSFNEAVTLDIPAAMRPDYHKVAGDLPYQQLASADAGFPTGYLYMPATFGGQHDEMAVVVAGQFSARQRTSMEIAWVIFANGEVRGYQIPVRSSNAVRSSGLIDQNGSAHLVWLNSAGFGRYEVYYASTAKAVRANLDRVSPQDVATDLLSAVWNLAPALGFFPPIFLLWTIASFVWVVTFYMIKVEGGMERRASKIALIMAILLYMCSKLFLMPSVLFYAPFADRVPTNLQYIPVIGAPVVTALIALGAVAVYFRRREYRSLLVTYLLFVITDAFLSLLIYVPAIVGP